MKSKLYFLISSVFTILFVSLPSVYSQTSNKGNSNSKTFSMEFAPKPENLKSYIPQKPTNFRGSAGYGNNIWANELYSFDTDNPLLVNVIADVNIQTASGDFDPGDDANIYVIDINANNLVKINIATGETVSTIALPVPVDGGIWTVLSIHKTTGAFYGVASNGTITNVYEIDPVTGASSLVFETGLSVVMSGTFDGAGMLWLFEIENDNIYKLNIASLNLELTGAAGFDGDSPQGMGYDALSDQVYLAAYEKNVGPQLRLLNRSTGAATFIGNLPGETTAFGFPGNVAPIEHIIQIPAGWSGVSSYVAPHNNDLVNILDPVSGEFILLKNIEGNIYWPQQNISTLQTWNSSEGYMIKMDQAATLTISGSLVENQTLDFSSGWNILAIVTPDETPVDALFENIEGFVMVKEIAGTGIYWPGQQINTIGNLIPGKAYYIYSTQNVSIAY
ncbi:MAG: hypothetical protein K9H16_15080 [Bacteroidales bacterium]|nr:hypothetical protein [Bacteroidales bacterium]